MLRGHQSGLDGKREWPQNLDVELSSLLLNGPIGVH